ncbi:hypothetical protein OPKNFCMD_2614 [Methylobacterium crusticola]|uniref:DUF1488 family protein n=2 Tax=Methylobacterium crusticola TaxID=1697972 RepID=A0ABQ4QX90_9HYPH|nr:hypothetical protein OPKNFCMD_2614 [Methylobacterium crusticola]
MTNMAITHTYGSAMRFGDTTYSVCLLDPSDAVVDTYRMVADDDAAAIRRAAAFTARYAVEVRDRARLIARMPPRAGRGGGPAASGRQG